MLCEPHASIAASWWIGPLRPPAGPRLARAAALISLDVPANYAAGRLVGGTLPVVLTVACAILHTPIVCRRPAQPYEVHDSTSPLRHRQAVLSSSVMSVSPRLREATVATLSEQVPQ